MTEVPFSNVASNVAELIEEIQTIKEKKSYQKAKTKLQETSTIKRVPGSLGKKVLLRHAKSGGKSPKKRRRKNESEK